MAAASIALTASAAVAATRQNGTVTTHSTTFDGAGKYGSDDALCTAPVN